MRIEPAASVQGDIAVPGDKSISHRAALLGAIGRGATEIHGYLEGEDCLGTLRAVAALGSEVTRKGPGHYVVQGAGLDGLTEPADVVDCGNSGTTARLLLGLLAGQPFTTVVSGDPSLRRRPMERVVEPLQRMGARVLGRDGSRRLPVAIAGSSPLRPLHHVSPVASAQVKSAILLAGLRASGPVTVEEPAVSRDHTERMLRAFGASVESGDRTATLRPGRPLMGREVRVPGDISSAAFFLVGGVLAPDGGLRVAAVGANPTRTGVLDVLERMGARIDRVAEEADVEPTATLGVSPSVLRGTSVGGDLIPRVIDELPILAVAAAAAHGATVVRDAQELRVKESDRLRALATELGKMGVRIEERPDGFQIEGRPPTAGRASFRGARVSSWGDHRLAMALVIAGLSADRESLVEDVDCVATSFPEFFATCRRLGGEECVEVNP
jgi:3-phosphoshikimate 1-carboxyvinyltransferase